MSREVGQVQTLRQDRLLLVCRCRDQGRLRCEILRRRDADVSLPNDERHVAHRPEESQERWHAVSSGDVARLIITSGSMVIGSEPRDTNERSGDAAWPPSHRLQSRFNSMVSRNGTVPRMGARGSTSSRDQRERIGTRTCSRETSTSTQSMAPRPVTRTTASNSKRMHVTLACLPIDSVAGSGQGNGVGVTCPIDRRTDQ